MNPEQALQLVEKAIANRKITAEKTYHICLWEGKIFCGGDKHTRDPHPVFLIIAERHLVIGLTNFQWETCLYHITEEYLKGDPCLKNLKL